MVYRIIPAGAYATAYEQNMSAGQNWDGESPTNEDHATHADRGVFDVGIFAVPADTVGGHGGKFTFGQRYRTNLTQIELSIPVGITEWKMYIERKGALFNFLSNPPTVVVGDFFYTKDADNLPGILVGDNVKLVTLGVPVSPSKCVIHSQYVADQR